MNKNASPAPNSVLMSGSKGFAHLFLVVVIVVIGLGGLLYYSWQKAAGPDGHLARRGLIKTTPTQEVSPTPYITDEPANLHTYSGKVYFKYPNTWSLDDSLANETYNARIILKKGWAKIEFGINLEGFGTSMSNYEGEEIIIAGNKFYKYKAKDYFGNPIIGITDKLQDSGLIRKNNMLYSINLNYPVTINSFQDDTPEKLESEFNQILSTFEFLDEEVNPEIACKDNGGRWFGEYNECEGIDEKSCISLGGSFDECAPAIGCRHEDKEVDCIPAAVCNQLCEFGLSN